MRGRLRCAWILALLALYLLPVSSLADPRGVNRHGVARALLEEVRAPGWSSRTILQSPSTQGVNITCHFFLSVRTLGFSMRAR